MATRGLVFVTVFDLALEVKAFNAKLVSMKLKKMVNITLKKCLLFFPFIFLLACESVPVKTYQEAEPSKKRQSITKQDVIQETQIDYPSIQRLLGLDRAISTLGYAEKTFNTCDVGFGYPKNESCMKKVYVVIHFKLMCRDSQGTVPRQISEDDLIPLSNRDLTWSLKNTNGTLRTDFNGYAQVVVVSPQSQKTERFRISSPKDFLLLRAGDIQRLIVPSNWCE